MWRIIFPALFVLSGCVTAERTDAVTDDRTASKPEPVYDSSTATAKVSGRVVFKGSRPEIAPSRISHPFCRQFGGIRNEQALIGPADGLQNVVIYVRSGYEGKLYKPPTEPVLLDQKGCTYIPHVVTVMTNQDLKIRNSERTFHNVHAQANLNTSFNIGQPTEGSEYSHRFAKPEMPVKIGCDMHSWMSSYVGVFDHPFHTVTAISGAYELRLPPGKYEIVAWHEKYGERTASVEVADQGTAELNFTFSDQKG
jgi:hypothetical protein